MSRLGIIAAWVFLCLFAVAPASSNAQLLGLQFGPPANPACATNGSDGFAGAPAATPLLPTLLAGYTAKPSWCVAGVNYGVGYPTGTSLTDWQSISQTGVSVNNGTGQISVSCSGGAVTLTAIDFTLHGGSFITVTTNNCNLTVTNSKLGTLPVAQSYNIHIQTTNSNLTVTNSVLNGGNGASAAYIGYQATGTVTLEYNYFANGDSHIIEQVSGTTTLIYKHNLIQNMAQVAGAHDNWLQWGTIGASTTADVEYNTSYTNFLNTGVVAGEGYQFYANNSGTLGTTTLSNNVMIALQYSSAATISSLVHGGTTSAGTNSNNYVDCSGCLTALPGGFAYPGSVVAGDGWTSSGNINMLTGTTITPN